MTTMRGETEDIEKTQMGLLEMKNTMSARKMYWMGFITSIMLQKKISLNLKNSSKTICGGQNSKMFT